MVGPTLVAGLVRLQETQPKVVLTKRNLSRALAAVPTAGGRRELSLTRFDRVCSPDRAALHVSPTVPPAPAHRSAKAPPKCCLARARRHRVPSLAARRVRLSTLLDLDPSIQNNPNQLARVVSRSMRSTTPTMAESIAAPAFPVATVEALQPS